jgi:hypothetical protein
MTTLLQHLELRAAEMNAWVAQDPQNRVGFSLTTDLAHWHDMGIFTVDQLELYELQSMYSDMFKDAYGGRPRSIPTDIEQLRNDIEMFSESIQQQIEADLEEEEYQKALELSVSASESDWERKELAAMAAQREYREGQVWANYQDGWI